MRKNVMEYFAVISDNTDNIEELKSFQATMKRYNIFNTNNKAICKDKICYG